MAVNPQNQPGSSMATGVKDLQKKKSVVTLDRSDVGPPGFFHYVALWIWIGWITFYLVFLISLPFLYVYSKIILSIMLGAMLISGLYPIERKLQPKWGYSIAWWAMSKAADYFRMTVVVEDEAALRASVPCIFALEPHDVIPVSYFSFNDCLNAIPGHSCVGTITSMVFSVPFLKHAYTWAGAVSVDKANILRHISSGTSVIICPGGVTEVALKESDKDCVLFLRSRFGFVKLALQQGVAIVPVFSFGLQNAFTSWIPKSKLARRMGKVLGFLPMTFFGVCGIPFSPAKPCKLANVVGPPIKLPKIADPSEAEIKKYHEMYLIEIARIYETYKDEFGMSDITLRIV